MAYKARFTSQVAIRLSPEMKAQLEAIADQEEVSVGSVMREAIQLGLNEGESSLREAVSR